MPRKKKLPENKFYDPEEKKEKKRSGKFSGTQFKNASSAEKVKKIIGILLLLGALLLFFSFVSFFFTWKYDQSLINETNHLVKSFKELKPELIHNIAGLLGAYLSHLFICRWFGIASFLFIPLITLAGIRMYFDIKVISFKKAIPEFIFLTLWISLFLGFVFHNSIDLLGGGFGYHAFYALRKLIGSIGIVLILLASLLVYLLVRFNFSLKIPSWRLKKKDKKIKYVLEEDDDSEEEGEEMPSSPESEPELTEQKETTSEEMPIDEEKPEPEPVIDGSSDISFEVEKAHGDEENGTVSELEQEDYDPTLELSNYKLPPLDLLKDYGETDKQINQNELEERKNLIIQTLRNYGIEIDKIKATVGPTITLYEIVPAAGIRISKIKNLEDDIALSLSALGIRIIAPIPGRGTIGIEVPNKDPELVSIRSVLSSSKFRNCQYELPVALGKTISNEVFIADLTKMPHLLIAGATGQGKSVGINVIISSLLYKKHPANVKFVFIDPKKVELSLYARLEKHFLAQLPDSETSIITDVDQVIGTLKSLTQEMDQRYILLKEARVRNIIEYNEKFVKRKLNPDKGHRYLPYIVLVIDELADLMMTAGKEVEMPIARLAQLARAIGIHLIIATQRPSVNIITGTIKANFPARIAFRVTASVDSRTILDAKGAEQLVGRGDMLFSSGSDLIRIQCAYIDTSEIENIVEFIADQPGFGHSYLLPEVEKESSSIAGINGDTEEYDELFEEAARIVVQHQQGSTSLLQRRLKLGYNRAGRIIDQLERAGIVGPFEGSKARAVLIPDEYELEQFLKNLRDNKSSA